MRRRTERPLLLRYGAAFLSIAVAALLRWLLGHFLGESIPFGIFFVAVIFTGWYGGIGPSLIASLLGTIAAVYFFLPSQGILVPAVPAGWLACGVFVLTGLAFA